jgi:hypothetical protein
LSSSHVSTGISAELFDKIVVFLVRADPEPHDEITATTCEGAVMVADSNRPNVSDKWFELHGGMKWIALPNVELVPGKTLHVRR